MPCPCENSGTYILKLPQCSPLKTSVSLTRHHGWYVQASFLACTKPSSPSPSPSSPSSSSTSSFNPHSPQTQFSTTDFQIPYPSLQKQKQCSHDPSSFQKRLLIASHHAAPCRPLFNPIATRRTSVLPSAADDARRPANPPHYGMHALPVSSVKSLTQPHLPNLLPLECLLNITGGGVTCIYGAIRDTYAIEDR